MINRFSVVLAIVVLSLVVGVWPGSTSAAEPGDEGILKTHVLEVFDRESVRWGTELTRFPGGPALVLFLFLATLQVFPLAQQMIRAQSLWPVLWNAKVMLITQAVVGFFIVFWTSTGLFIPSFFAGVGSALGPDVVDPDSLISQGIGAVRAYLKPSNYLLFLAPPTALMPLIGTAMLLFSYLVMGFAATFVLVEVRVVAALGSLILAFGAFKGTAGAADALVGYLFALGIRIMVILFFFSIIGAFGGYMTETLEAASGPEVGALVIGFGISSMILALIVLVMPIAAAVGFGRGFSFDIKAKLSGDS